MRGGRVEKKVLYRASWNCTFCQLIRLKSLSVRGASHHAVFMVLALIMGVRRGDEYKISFYYPEGLRVFLQTYLEWGGRIWCVWNVCRWLIQWRVILALLGVDATLGDGCGIWEYLHSFREVKCHQDYLKTLLMGGLHSLFIRSSTIGSYACCSWDCHDFSSIVLLLCSYFFLMFLKFP